MLGVHKLDFVYYILYVVSGKVIIYKSRGDVSLLEQPKIVYVFLAYQKFTFKFQSKKIWFLTFMLCNFLVTMYIFVYFFISLTHKNTVPKNSIL